MTPAAYAAETGGVVGWGSNGSGQTTVPAAARSGVTQVSAGSWHTLALKTDGGVVGWGSNGHGQTTVPAAAQSEVVQVAAGGWHSLALKADGTLVAWGSNQYGQITVPTTAQSNVTQVAAGEYHSLALKADGSVVAWGRSAEGQTAVPAAAHSDVVQVDAGGWHSLALKADGSVVGWGNNGSGQSDGRTGVAQVSAGGDHNLAITEDGNVIAWGLNLFGQGSVPVAAQSDVVQVDAGQKHNLALKTDGSVVAWGYNWDRQATVPPEGVPAAFQVSAGAAHSVALSTGGWLSFARAGQSTTESSPTAQLQVTRDGATDRELTVGYAVTGGTATAGADFTLAPGTLTFSPGQTTSTISVAIRNDSRSEAAERVVVTLQSPGPGAVIGAPESTTLTIRTSDQRPDAMVSTAATSGYVGDDIYNSTGTRQTQTLTARPRQARDFYLRVYNDGNTSTKITLMGSAATSQSAVRYHSGGSDVTAPMRSTAGLAVTLAPNAYRQIRVRISLLRTARPSTAKTVTLTGAWTGDGTRIDTARAVVNVIR